MSLPPPIGWTNDEDDLQRTYYWEDKPDTLRDVLEKRYGLINVDPVWARDADYGGVLFIFQGERPRNQLHYFLWNGMTDRVAQCVERNLQNIKNQIISGQGYLKNVKFKNVE